MEIKIGIMNVARELSLESDESSETVLDNFEKAVKDGGSLVLRDNKGRTVAVPAASIGYLDLGSDSARPVGFGAV